MKYLIVFIFFSGLSIIILSQFLNDDSSRFLYLGLLVVLACYLLFIIFLYEKKVNVHARGGLLNFLSTRGDIDFISSYCFFFGLCPVSV